jgi:membrane fusion protein (multidrug efflux system)
MIRKAQLRVFASISVAAMLCGCSQQPPDKPAAPPTAMSVQCVHPKRGAITRFVTLPGEIKPYQEATLYAKVAGYLKTITVDKGDSVQEGVLLAELEVPELLADRSRYLAEVDVAGVDYRRLSESQKKASDLVMPQVVDEARGKWEVAKANLERTETLLKYARILAPFGGIITRRYVDPGAFIPAATSGGTPQSAALLTLTDFSRVRLQVAVPEAEAPLVAVGQPVKLTVEGLAERRIEGKVTRFAYALAEDSRTMLTEIELPNPTLELRPGMYASVQIGLEHKNDALLIPAEALLVEKSGTAVFLVADNKAKKTRVQTGFNDGSNVEIINGLNPEQAVILVGKRTLTDGQAVNVAESK